MPGALVALTYLCDPKSPNERIRAGLDFRAIEGSPASTTDPAGQVHFTHLPRIPTSCEAIKPGFAVTPCFAGQTKIRLTPTATLEGTLTGPAGQPLPGVLIRMATGFMWAFEQTRTDDQGHYRFEGLRARGWDLSAWQAGQVADGSYKLWIDSPEFAVPTQLFVLEPNERRNLDLHSQPAGVVRITVVEKGTNRSVPGVRVWSFDNQPNGPSRFNATTDDQGLAVFHTVPTHLYLSIVGPPEGTFVDQDRMGVDSAISLDFAGGEVARTLILPQISGRLVTIKGNCFRPDGQPATGATVHASATSFVSATAINFIRPRQVDPAGEFVLDEVPAGRDLGLIILDEDRKLGAWMTTKVSKAGEPAAPPRLTLRPLVTAESVLKDRRGKILRSREFTVMPKLGSDFLFLRRQNVKSDEQGKIRVEGVVPGLTYHVREEPAFVNPSGMAKMSTKAFDQDLILAPEGGQ